jgi:endonuclease/exonuclease/phosphatase family metal-dependent hydrolase
MAFALRVATYNTMLTVPEPLRFNGQKERAERIAGTLHRMAPDLDVVVFTELIAERMRDTVVSDMARHGWPHSTKVLRSSALMSSSLKLVSGGVVVVSKHPIILETSYIFEDVCQGYDCTAFKGAVFCRIVKDGNVVNVLATHMQAWDTPDARDIRRRQAGDCRLLLESLNLLKDEPVVLVGDLNIDFYTRQNDLQEVLGVLGATLCERKGPVMFTSDPSTNGLMGNDDDTMYATRDHPKGCYEDYLTTGSCACCPQEWLDYVGYFNGYASPTRAEMRVLPVKAARPFRMKLNLTTTREMRDLSDHYPVVADFEFPQPTPFGDRLVECTLPAQAKVGNLWTWVFVLIGLLVGGLLVGLACAHLR